MSEVDTKSPEDTGEEIPVPPATLEFLITSLRVQAEVQLGLLHFGPESERPKPNLKMARHAIDMLDVLSAKTRGNLTLDEQRLLENTLTELRFRYVQVVSDQSKATPPSGQPA